MSQVGRVDAGRVIAGSARGSRLRGPGEGTRPYSDRLKESLFAMLEPYLPGARVLDLFAGSGAGGIEALSRGAASAVFVERDPGAVAVIAENLRHTRQTERATVVKADVVRYLRERAAQGGPFDVILVDPPFPEPALLEAALSALDEEPGIMGPEAWVVARHFWRNPPPATAGLLASVRTKRVGEGGLVFYRPLAEDAFAGAADAVDRTEAAPAQSGLKHQAGASRSRPKEADR